MAPPIPASCAMPSRKQRCHGVALDPIYIALVAVAQHLAACLVVGAFGPHRAGVAGTRLGFVEDLVSGRPEGLGREGLARGTLVEVLFGVVDELLLAKVGARLACPGQRHVSSDASTLHGGYVLSGAVGGIAGNLPRSDLPTEAGAPK